MYVPSTLYSKMAKHSIPTSFDFQGLQGPNLGQGSGMLSGRIDNSPNVEGVSFKNTLTNMASQVNDVAQAPDKLMTEAMTGGKVDIHQVMIANAKAELTINIATQVATKVIQAYDRVQQIQV